MSATLRLGSKNEFVIMLQTALRNAGLYKGTIDGTFGSTTDQAVKLFQTSAGLSADGIVGPKTWEAINKITEILTNKILFAMIHCTASREGQEWTADNIRQTHMGPQDNADGTVTYKAKRYPNRDALPNETIGGVHIKNLKGRGWTKPGYFKMVHLDGRVSEIVPRNDNQFVESFEVTFGALGFNNNCLHIVYVGGARADDWRIPKDTRTNLQKEVLRIEIQKLIKEYPHIKVLGHNQVANKSCPSFDVPEWLREIGVEEKNIF
jgi:hypothetical protein